MLQTEQPPVWKSMICWGGVSSIGAFIMARSNGTDEMILAGARLPAAILQSSAHPGKSFVSPLPSCLDPAGCALKPLCSHRINRANHHLPMNLSHINRLSRLTRLFRVRNPSSQSQCITIIRALTTDPRDSHNPGFALGAKMGAGLPFSGADISGRYKALLWDF